MSQKTHRRDSESSTDSNFEDILHGVVARSGLLLKFKDDSLSPVAYDNVQIDDDNSITPSTSSTQLNWNRLAKLPIFEQLMPHLSRSKMRQNFFHNVRINDLICAQVVRVKTVVLEVKLICMLTRFRRCISLFLNDDKIVLCYNRNKQLYQINDFITVVVKLVNIAEEKLELEIVQTEAILQSINLPSYYRNYLALSLKEPDDLEDYDNSESLNFLTGNVNLSEQLSIRIDSQHSGLRCFEGKLLENSFESAEKLKFAQNRRLAMTFVKRGAELTRAGKCFEAIQCFNKALNVDENCDDAYVGRGAACAGSNNFTAALSDLEKALEIEPEHKNAMRYRIDVLIAYGKELEKKDQLFEASKKYELAIKLSNSENERAINSLKRISLLTASKTPKSSKISIENNFCNSNASSSIIDVIDLSDESDCDSKLKKNFRKNRSSLSSNNQYQSKRESGAHFKSKELNKKNEYSPKKIYSLSTNKNQKNNCNSISNNSSAKIDSDNRRKLQEIEAFIAQLKRSK